MNKNTRMVNFLVKLKKKKMEAIFIFCNMSDKRYNLTQVGN